MTVDDIIKFYEDESNLFTDKDVEKYCGIAHEEVATMPNKNVTTKAKTMKPQKIVLTKVQRRSLKLNQPNRKWLEKALWLYESDISFMLRLTIVMWF